MILITGFEPFGEVARNPSGEIATALDEVPGLRGAVLPVDWIEIGRALSRLLATPFRGVILTGVANDRSRISLERVAVNRRGPGKTDNAGRSASGSFVVTGGPDVHLSTLPLEAARARLEREGIPVEISPSAGTYLCNAAFYLARHALDGSGIPCGFVHVPPLPDPARPGSGMDLDVTRRAISLVAEEVRSVTS